jgi:hypothetical protein
MFDDHDQDSNPAARPSHQRKPWWLVVIALVIGLAIGRGSSIGPVARAADPTVDATATRTAELAELNDLRTKVAQTVVCTPPATSTPTMTPEPTFTPTVVPVVPVGEAIQYGKTFTITVNGITDVGQPDDLQPNGRFLGVYVTMENLTNSPQWPSFDDWRLVDSSGKSYRLDSQATQNVFGKTWGLPVSKNATEERGVVFDVPVDVGDTFILESDTQPTFRVGLVLESRG